MTFNEPSGFWTESWGGRPDWRALFCLTIDSTISVFPRLRDRELAARKFLTLSIITIILSWAANLFLAVITTVESSYLKAICHNYTSPYITSMSVPESSDKISLRLSTWDMKNVFIVLVPYRHYNMIEILKFKVDSFMRDIFSFCLMNQTVKFSDIHAGYIVEYELALYIYNHLNFIQEKYRQIYSSYVLDQGKC